MRFFESTYGWVQPMPCGDGPQGGVWTVPGDEGMKAAVVVDWFYREAGYGNDLVIYTVDDNQGKIGSLSPDDDGYAAAAASRKMGVLDAPNCTCMNVPNHQYDVPEESPMLVKLSSGTKFSFYLVQGTYECCDLYAYKWFPFSEANVDGYQHFQEVTTADSEANWYGDWNQDLFAYKVEDLSNDTENYPNPAGFDNDADFNDVVFTVSTVVIDLETVAFTGAGLDGIPMQDHYEDKNGNNLRDTGEDAASNDISVAPEWVGDDVDVASPAWLEDGQDDDSDPERNKHALVAKATQFKVKAVFKIEDDPGLAVTAWATCTDENLALASEGEPVTLEKVGDKWQGTFQINTAPTTIGLLKDFTWTWHVKIGDQVTDNQNTSTHTVFVCKEAFEGDKPYDWVAWLSCAWASGAAAPVTDATIVEAIGVKACDDDATGQVISGVDFNYSITAEDSTEELLQDKEGNCHAFARFLQDLGRVQSIGITMDSIHSTWDFQEKPPNKYHLWGTDKSDRDGDKGPGFTFTNPNGQPEVAFEDEWIWKTHAFCSFGDRVYDPSTGRTFTGQDGNVPDWQEYFFDLMTRYVSLLAYPLESTDSPADDTVQIRHAENRVANTDDAWIYLP